MPLFESSLAGKGKMGVAEEFLDLRQSGMLRLFTEMKQPAKLAGYFGNIGLPRL